jgi:lipoprotein-releasing system permease protein
MGQQATLTVVPLTSRGTLGALQPARNVFVVVNEFKSGLYEVDANRVYVPFDVLQRMLDMDAREVHEQWDPVTGEPVGDVTKKAARATELMLKGVKGVPLAELKAAVRAEVDAFLATDRTIPYLQVQTWEERHAMLLGAVEKEKGLLTILFAIISLVAIAMIAVIFYMIVLEKTRDIGTLRALGASRSGIAGIFMGYGLAIGVVGSALGLVLATAIVINLNEIQDLLFHWFQFKMWDPRIYYFEKIPATINRQEVTVILFLAVLSSLMGAVIPALLAARLNPVDALRYE